MINEIINLLYPGYCQICNKKIMYWRYALCKDCVKKINVRIPPFCQKCGKQLLDKSGEIQICPDCRTITYYFDQAFSVAHYDTVLKHLIHNFKYRKIVSLLADFTDIMVEFMYKYNIDRELELILSIPMHPARFITREINPSHLLARSVAKRLKMSYSGNILKKIKNTVPQSTLSRHDRMKNIKGSFGIHKTKVCVIKDKNILLVDDLFTTGSTASECAKVLKCAGARVVKVLTLGRGDTQL